MRVDSGRKGSGPVPPVLEVRGLAIERDSAILRGIDWTVRAGEHWAVLGANGSGKTSLLSALTGYLTPSRGEVRVLGRKFGEFDWRELRKAVGLVSSSIRQRIDDGETALEIVVSGKTAMLNFWGRISAADRKRALALLRQVDGGKLAERPWLFLSQGERQRVLIARALMAELRLLILDEPCAGLDPVAREQFLRFIGKLMRSKDGPTLVLVTHHVEEIVPEFSHLLAIKGGRTLAAGAVGKTLTSRMLSEAFGAGLKLARSKGRYRAELAEAGGKGRAILSRRRRAQGAGGGAGEA